jgi:PAS domain S-box-containing protein
LPRRQGNSGFSNGTYKRARSKLLALYGLTEFDGRYESWLQCLFQEDVPRIVHLIENGFAERAHEWNAEFRIVRRSDEALRWMEARNIVFYDGGKPARVVGVSADVTERKRGLIQLRAFTETLEERVKERTSSSKPSRRPG